MNQNLGKSCFDVLSIENHEKNRYLIKQHTEITVSRIVLRWFSNHQAEQIPLVLAWTSVDTIYLICSSLKARLNWTMPVVLMVCSWLSSDHMVVACCGWNEADKHPYLFSMTESKPKSPSRKSSFSGHSQEPFLAFFSYSGCFHIVFEIATLKIDTEIR